MAKGRPPDPTREKRHTGHRPLPAVRAASAALSTLAAVPEPPETLPESGHELWTTICSELVPRGLTAGELPLVEMLVRAVLRNRQASRAIDRYGILLTYRVGGSVRGVPNPMLRVEKDTAATCLRLAETLGLSPAARVRLGLMQVAGQSLLLQVVEQIREQAAANIARQRKGKPG